MLVKLKNGTEFVFIDKLTMGVLYAIAPLLEKGMDKLSQMEQFKLFEIFINATLIKPIDFSKLAIDDFKELIESEDFKKLMNQAVK